ncbi:hypothetical protein GGTG_04894 [Gaeumannomyces tritici R3-111a-1]|uniref:MARVEL domain-containing protein n=1 Tax=Gaeumannomyces tritici (strain R3-111a-1) TaxID=644352 RepID=J3NUD8_GAET3|nr:hypothetical protein GGTG_04894 [Gaeumannomyces tritici R3-111a-1]EJT79811.1 hypothetical protein GGTG_04894 [Gaeumannomyces tritici R3-111a-1]
MDIFRHGKSYILFLILHFFAFVLSLTVIGLYAQDIQRAREAGKHSDPKWVFAVVVGALSAVTALIYFVPFVLRFAVVPIWNTILFVLWIAVFGVFGAMYIHEDPEGDGGIKRMKDAVWIDLANAVMWLILALTAFVYWWGHRERHSRFTGRAKV